MITHTAGSPSPEGNFEIILEGRASKRKQRATEKGPSRKRLGKPPGRLFSLNSPQKKNEENGVLARFENEAVSRLGLPPPTNQASPTAQVLRERRLKRQPSTKFFFDPAGRPRSVPVRFSGRANRFSKGLLRRTRIFGACAVTDEPNEEKTAEAQQTGAGWGSLADGLKRHVFGFSNFVRGFFLRLANAG